MKKIVWGIIILILIAGGMWFVTRGKKVLPNPALTTYNNSNLGISFTYPKILSASTTDESVTLHHEVAFAHHNFCDFKGESASSTANLTDFDVTFHIADGSLIDTMRAENPEIPQENFINGAIVPSPGFIDPYSVGNLNGFKLSESAEGCGQVVYFLSLSSARTLVVKQALITVFTGTIDPVTQANARAVPGVITPDSSDQIFTSILKTLKAQ